MAGLTKKIGKICVPFFQIISLQLIGALCHSFLKNICAKTERQIIRLVAL